jgi:enediyne biosynthesis protein E4
VQVRLQQAGANRDAIGSVIEIRRGDAVERHEIASGGGHVSGSVGWLHFGLGAEPAAEMRVIWPDGTPGDWVDLPAQSFQIIQPGTGRNPGRPAEHGLRIGIVEHCPAKAPRAGVALSPSA